MNKIITIASTLLMLGSLSPVSANIISDFDDNTLQGWHLGVSDSGFNLENPGSGGNDGGYLSLNDTSIGGFGGLARAPVEFNGDLSTYVMISWDSLLPNNAFDPVTLIISDFSNTTTWVYTPDSTLPANDWESWSVDLDGGNGWSRTEGSATFADVLTNVGTLAFDLEVSSGTSVEAGIDNVMLTAIPLPAALWLFAGGLLGLIGMARRPRG